MRAWIVICIFGFATSSAGAATPLTAAWQVGIGRMSCAHWLSSPQSASEGEVWIMGYWTGVNVVNDKNHMVGSHTDADAIFGETKKICTNEPSSVLSDAVARVYYQFQQSGK
jgi:hypothetical protein